MATLLSNWTLWVWRDPSCFPPLPPWRRDRPVLASSRHSRSGPARLSLARYGSLVLTTATGRFLWVLLGPLLQALFAPGWSVPRPPVLLTERAQPYGVSHYPFPASPRAPPSAPGSSVGPSCGPFSDLSCGPFCACVVDSPTPRDPMLLTKRAQP